MACFTDGNGTTSSDISPPWLRAIRTQHLMRRPLSSRVRQHDTHKELVGRAGTHVAPASPPRLDAIIVPASRHASNLDHAVTLARAARCRLVVLCSHDAVRADLEQFFSSRSFEWGVVIDVPRGYALP